MGNGGNHLSIAMSLTPVPDQSECGQAASCLHSLEPALLMCLACANGLYTFYHGPPINFLPLSCFVYIYGWGTRAYMFMSIWRTEGAIPQELFTLCEEMGPLPGT